MLCIKKLPNIFHHGNSFHGCKRCCGCHSLFCCQQWKTKVQQESFNWIGRKWSFLQENWSKLTVNVMLKCHFLTISFYGSCLVRVFDYDRQMFGLYSALSESVQLLTNRPRTTNCIQDCNRWYQKVVYLIYSIVSRGLWSFFIILCGL